MVYRRKINKYEHLSKDELIKMLWSKEAKINERDSQIQKMVKQLNPIKATFFLKISLKNIERVYLQMRLSVNSISIKSQRSMVKNSDNATD